MNLPITEYNKEWILALQCVKENGMDLHACSQDMRDDETIVMEAVRGNYQAIQYASKRLKDDKDFVMKLLTEVDKNSKNANPVGSIFTYLGDLKDDKDIALLSLDWSPRILREFNDILKDDGDVILKAIKKEGTTLVYASDRLKDNFSIVKVALKDPLAFQYISPQLQKDVKVYDFIYDNNFMDFFNLKQKTFIENTELKNCFETYLKKVEKSREFYLDKFHEIDKTFVTYTGVMLDMAYYEPPLIHILEKMDNKDIMQLKSESIFINKLIERQKVLNIKMTNKSKKKSRTITI